MLYTTNSQEDTVRFITDSDNKQIQRSDLLEVTQDEMVGRLIQVSFARVTSLSPL